MSRRLLSMQGDRVLTALWDDGRIIECSVDERVPAFLGRIYLAKVDHIVPSISGAFLSAGDQKLYYSLKENPLPVAVSCKREGIITQGDEIVVQVTKEALKAKEPGAGSALQIGGRYCVVMMEPAGKQPKTKILLSRKITEAAFREKISEEAEALEEVKQLFEAVSLRGFSLSVMVRTNAAEVSSDLVLDEISVCCRQLQTVLSTAAFRSSGSLLWQPLPAYISAIRDTSLNGLESIVCDNEELLNEVKNALDECKGSEGLTYSLYQDSSYPMRKCYNLDTTIEKALKSKVYLSSGAYLIIEQTEALVAIDVNTGKAIASGRKKENQDSYFYRINLEAAKEILYQLRLRNLSGMILVDFINMTDHALEDALMEELSLLARKDPVHTRIVDITALGLVEITRKKIREPLDKQLKIC